MPKGYSQLLLLSAVVMNKVDIYRSSTYNARNLMSGLKTACIQVIFLLPNKKEYLNMCAVFIKNNFYFWSIVLWMITKTCRYSFEVLDFNCNSFGFINKTWVGYLVIYDTNGLDTGGTVWI